MVTTPQLHFMVNARNKLRAEPPGDHLSLYFDTLIGAFECLVEGLPLPPDGGVLHVDCANGVGAMHLERAAERLRGAGLSLKLHNTGDGRLNDGCGADFVQKERTLPSGAGFQGLEAGARCCSFDGDADRLVYFTLQRRRLGDDDGGGAPSRSDAIELLDGDKIATLAAAFIRDLVDRLPSDVLSEGVRVGPRECGWVSSASSSSSGHPWVASS